MDEFEIAFVFTNKTQGRRQIVLVEGRRQSHLLALSHVLFCALLDLAHAARRKNCFLKLPAIVVSRLRLEMRKQLPADMVHDEIIWCGAKHEYCLAPHVRSDITASLRAKLIAQKKPRKTRVDA